jgi:hypothetical protein
MYNDTYSTSKKSNLIPATCNQLTEYSFTSGLVVFFIFSAVVTKQVSSTRQYRATVYRTLTYKHGNRRAIEADSEAAALLVLILCKFVKPSNLSTK